MNFFHQCAPKKINIRGDGIKMLGLIETNYMFAESQGSNYFRGNINCHYNEYLPEHNNTTISVTFLYV